MIQILRGWWDAFTGAGDYAVTVPPMDGPLQPNTNLELAQYLATIEIPDSMCVHDKRLLVSNNNTICAFDAGSEALVPFNVYDQPITALASDGSAWAVALADGTIEWTNALGVLKRLKLPSAAGVPCITALLLEDELLTVANGSARSPAAEWKRDLMQKDTTGSLWQCHFAGEFQCLADGLAFPYGLARTSAGHLACSESWRHRIVEIVEHKPPRALLADLPAYPARLSTAPDGGYWLAAFAPRTQMVEFMLRENAARRRMIETVHPDYWMAPRYASGRSFKEPLQGGGIKQLGILKPWAPSQSYGLVIRLNHMMQPVESHHSRADGTIHGITDCQQIDGQLFACSKGAGRLVTLDINLNGEAAV